MHAVRAARLALGLSQAEVGARAGVSRQLVGAVEAGRHRPGVDAALALAAALQTTVEALFGAAAPPPITRALPGAPGGPRPEEPLALARVGDRLVWGPLGASASAAEAWHAADAAVDPAAPGGGVAALPGAATDGLAVAGCDPALGLAAALLARRGRRLVAFPATTTTALDALAAGTVHAAAVHGPPGGLPEPPVPVRRLHLARWQVGLAGRRRVPSLDEVAGRRLRLVQRDAGAASQQALRRALRRAGAPTPAGPVASGHLDAARQAAHGVAPAALTMEAAALSHGLAFTSLEAHDVEVWVAAAWAGLEEVAALADLLGGPAFAARLSRIGGYDLSACGEVVG